jgi:hypothetical protein
MQFTSIYEYLYPIINFGRLRSVQRLCQIHGLDLLTPRQIGNCARQFEDPVIQPRRQIALRHAQHSVAARIRL